MSTDDMCGEDVCETMSRVEANFVQIKSPGIFYFVKLKEKNLHEKKVHEKKAEKFSKQTRNINKI